VLSFAFSGFAGETSVPTAVSEERQKGAVAGSSGGGSSLALGSLSRRPALPGRVLRPAAGGSFHPRKRPPVRRLGPAGVGTHRQAEPVARRQSGPFHAAPTSWDKMTPSHRRAGNRGLATTVSVKGPCNGTRPLRCATAGKHPSPPPPAADAAPVWITALQAAVGPPGLHDAPDWLKARVAVFCEVLQGHQGTMARA
jgi:hypothetical protein